MPDLRKVTITRRDDGRWDVVRERDDTGERFTGLSSLDECIAMVQAVAGGNDMPKKTTAKVKTKSPKGNAPKLDEGEIAKKTGAKRK